MHKTLRNWAANLLLLVIPLLVIGLTEYTLRALNIGEDLRLFVPARHNPDLMVVNQKAGKRFFSGGDFGSFGTQDMFRKIKPPGTLRIFALGGSSTAGYPYMFSGSFPALLETGLTRAYPTFDVEVINLGMTAVTSYTVLDLAREAIHQGPDLFVVYMGHNEFYGTLGSASTQRIGGSYFLTWSYLNLSHFKLFQLFRGLLHRAVSSQGSPADVEHRTLMARMVGDEAIPLNSDLYLKTLDHFNRNLSRLIQLAAKYDIPIVIGTPVSNLSDQPPFVSLRDSTAAGIDDLLIIASVQSAAGNYADAMETYESVLRVDSTYAQIWYDYGQALEALGRHTQALQAYTCARDLDGLRFRASSDFIRLIEELGRSTEATVVNLDSALVCRSQFHTIGEEYFLEHLHPNLEGYQEIARAFAQTIIDERLLVPYVVPEISGAEVDYRDHVAVTGLDSVAANFRIRLLTAGWPFKARGRTLRAGDLPVHNKTEEIALKLISGELNYERAHVELATYQENRGAIDAAVQEYTVLTETFPWSASPFVKLGQLLVNQRRFKDALPYLLRASELSNDAFSRKWAGTILLEQGQADQALPHLVSAVSLNPLDTQARYNLAGAYFRAGHNAEALRELELLLSRQPNFPDARQFYDRLKAAQVTE